MTGGGRASGLLLHPTALPGPGGCGGFGAAAREWIDLLSREGVEVWQVLPLAPTDGTGSPYSSPSDSALNPWLVDAEELLAAGLIEPADLHGLPVDHADRLDPRLATDRATALARALRHRWPQLPPSPRREFAAWCRRHPWIRDHSRYMVLRRLHGGRAWWEWPEPLARRNRRALQQLDRDHRDALLEESLLQWQLQGQWRQLRRRAAERGVRILGDLPFYVAHDSCDVWRHPQLFSLGPGGTLNEQSGVPPDYFSATGQLWGTPVYLWRNHLISGFRWWIRRLERQLELFDLLRLDHFRALEAYWSVPGSDTTAERGRWRRSPGDLLLALLWVRRLLGGGLQPDGRLPLIAEDLGVITPAVEGLRDRFGLPGMKILQFAFDGNPDNPYLPANYEGSRWVVYTGTHDNATTLGWWHELDGDSRARVAAVVGEPVNAPGWQLLEAALASKAELAMVPLQDLLELGNEARFNTPGTTAGNWSWRLGRPIGDIAGPVHGYGAMAALHGRGPGAAAGG